MWLYIPREYCPCSPELLDSISEFGLFFQSQELFVTLSGKATQRPYSWRGWKTRPWMKLLSGVTLQPSTQAAGMELWIQSVSASHASQSQSQANELESRKGHDQDSSLKPAELFAKYDQGIFLSKTSQDSFLTSSCQSYSANFPKWGSMRSGECFQQEMWVAPTLEKESLSWRTPRATEYKNPDQSHANKAKGLPVEHLSAQAKIWPTPRSGNPGSRPNKKGGKILNEEAQNWGTPTVDAISNRKNKYAQGGTPSAMQASSWPTPGQRDYKGDRAPIDGKNISHSSGTRFGMGLDGATKSWPTPAMRDYKGTYNTIIRKDGKCRNDQLANASIYTGPMAPAKQSNGSDSSKSAQTSPQPLKKRLNPKFVEHLMGMPLGWSLPIPIDQNDYKRWETESARLLRLLHTASYGNE